MEVTVNTVVSLRYTMKNSHGDILENIMEMSPVNYLHGGGSILPALEASLKGMQQGEKKSITISDKTDNQLHDTFHFDVVIDNVRWATEDEIQKGKPVQPTEKNECGPGCCC